MFQAGDAVVHPVRGAGVIERIVERQWRGGTRRYYTISLLGQPATSLMIPAVLADEMGLRHVVSEAKLARVWRVFEKPPEELPVDHKERYKVIEDRLSSNEILDLAGIVRDLAWRQRVQGRLTIKGTRIYEQALGMLAGEVAAARGISFDEAERALRGRLSRLPEPPAAD